MYKLEIFVQSTQTLKKIIDFTMFTANEIVFLHTEWLPLFGVYTKKYPIVF